MKSFNQYLSESVPTNSTGSSQNMPGLSGISLPSWYGGMPGYDKRLFPPADDTLDQDYQTPGESGQAIWRSSNVYPVQKLSDKQIDTMVNASKKFVNMKDENTQQRIKKTFSSFMEEAPVNNVGGGAIAGTPEADPGNPPVFNKKKKRKPTPVGRYGSRRMWLQDLRKDGK